ncbi:hypothetical protein QR680_016482 [Steinernema hermaphroditum]|uniref:Uncharacterized protein n=1 Tax=Steinernema hermaphroditum TaxID=289476 RepID=A0AA39HBC2_9BILA|nr:hypothetical protein QR680_016482 [Steinernema hermaphroditum]
MTNHTVNPYRFPMGAAFVTVSLLSIFLNLVTAQTFLVHVFFRKRTCFRIMALLAVAESVYQTVSFVCGLFTLFDTTFDDFFETLLTSIAASSKTAMFLLTVLLAVNRFATISRLRPLPSKYFTALMVVILIVATSQGVLQCGVAVTTIFSLDYAVMTTKRASSFDTFLCVVYSSCIALTFVLYVAIAVFIMFRRRKAGGKRILAPMEGAVLLQSIFVFLSYTTVIVISHYGNLIERGTASYGVLSHVKQVLLGVFNPVIHFAFNSRFRTSVLRKLGTNPDKIKPIAVIVKPRQC